LRRAVRYQPARLFPRSGCQYLPLEILNLRASSQPASAPGLLRAGDISQLPLSGLTFGDQTPVNARRGKQGGVVFVEVLPRAIPGLSQPTVARHPEGIGKSFRLINSLSRINGIGGTLHRRRSQRRQNAATRHQGWNVEMAFCAPSSGGVAR
jgi:hypothetical protein